MIEKYKLYTGVLFAFIWITLCWGFVQDEICPALESFHSFVFLAADVMFLLLGIYAIKDQNDTWIILSFVAIVIVSAILNKQGIVTIFNGFRDFIGMLLAVPIIRRLVLSKYSQRFVMAFDKQLLIFLLLQAVCVTWQYFKYGPGDEVGGSMGDGASGTISVLIYFVSFYLMCRRWDYSRSYMVNIKANFFLILLLYPTFLNETKISIVLFVFYFVFLVKIDRTIAVKALIIAPVMAILGFFSVAVYSYVVETDVDNVFNEDNMHNYFVGDDIDYLIDVAEMVQDEEIETDNVWAVDIPRLSKLALAPAILNETGGKSWLGAGIGQFKGLSVIGQTPFAKKYNWFLQGSRPLLFFIFVQLGVIGLLWMLTDFIHIFQSPSRYDFVWNIRLFLYLLLAFSMLYNDSFRLFSYCFILFYTAMSGLKGRTSE